MKFNLVKKTSICSSFFVWGQKIGVCMFIGNTLADFLLGISANLLINKLTNLISY